MKLLITLFFISAAYASDPCARNPLCDELNDASNSCVTTLKEKSCDKFVTLFEKLMEKQVCPKEDFKFGIYSCDLKLGLTPVGVQYDRLSKLPFKNAIKLFSSEKLRNSLDDILSIQFKKKSLAAKNYKTGSAIPECVGFRPLDFNKEKIATVGSFTVLKGETTKITHTKSKKGCEVKNFKEVKDVDKMNHHDVLRFISTDGSGLARMSLVLIKNCEVAWESEWAYGDSLDDRSNLQVKNVSDKNSFMKQCEPCWNKDKEACLRIN